MILARADRLGPYEIVAAIGAGGMGAVEIFSKLKDNPAPVTRDVLQIIGRFAWYDTFASSR
jgi:hypothetical protein